MPNKVGAEVAKRDLVVWAGYAGWSFFLHWLFALGEYGLACVRSGPLVKEYMRTRYGKRTSLAANAGKFPHARFR